MQHIDFPESLDRKLPTPNILTKEHSEPFPNGEEIDQISNMPIITPIVSEKLELPRLPRKRPRSYSYDDRRDSDSDDTCEIMFNMSIEEIIDQDKRMKDQITYLIRKLDREHSIKLCILLLEKYPELLQVSKEFLIKTSLRFQQIIYVNKNKRKHKKEKKLRVKSKRSRSGSTTMPTMPRRQLTAEQKYRDFIRLQAYILTLMAFIPHQETLKIVDLLLHEFPELKVHNSKYFILTNPRGFDILNGE